ncbi:MAG: PEP-CTERM sorting domain-containing protein [Planctomycetota bacterium]
MVRRFLSRQVFRGGVLALGACLPLTCLAPSAEAIQFDSFDPTRHERFLGDDSNNPDFLLAGFDLSGIAKRGNAGSGAVLITPQHFITADHFLPTAVNGSVTFRGTDGTDRSYTVTGYDQLITNVNTLSGPVVGGSDLTIGTLAAPIDPLTDFINPLPIAFAFDINDFVGLEVFTFGNGDLAGRNVISSVNLSTFAGGDRPSLTFSTLYETVENSGGDDIGPLTDGLGPDEAGLQGGDSGNAALTVIDGELAVLGSHFGISLGGPFDDFDQYSSTSSLFSPYILQVFDVVQDEGQFFDVAFVPIPEPSTAAVLLLGLSLAAVRRRSSHAPS